MRCATFPVASLALLLAGATASQAQAPRIRYSVVDRGPSLVRTLVNTPGLNSRGDLAIWQASGPNRMQGVVYRRNHVTSLAGGPAFPLIYPADVNDALHVVGTAQASEDLRYTQAFESDEGRLLTLPGIGGRYSAATAINNQGEVVGSAQDASGTRHAVLWKAHRPTDLGLLEKGDYSSARDINDRGDIVGEANSTANGNPHAVLWHDGQVAQLPEAAGSSFCSAQAINEQGVVVGSCELANGFAQGVMWRGGKVEALGTLGDEDAPSTALDINTSLQVVGSSEIVDGKLRAFLWQNGRMLDLNTMIDPGSGWVLLAASRINDHGVIAGRGYFHGAIHAFLLEPVEAGVR